MAGNLFSGSNIRLDQVEGALQEAKKSGSLRIEYSKIRCFAEALSESAGGKSQIPKYDVEDLADTACRECNIVGRDADEIMKILTGSA